MYDLWITVWESTSSPFASQSINFPDILRRRYETFVLLFMTWGFGDLPGYWVDFLVSVVAAYYHTSHASSRNRIKPHVACAARP